MHLHQHPNLQSITVKVITSEKCENPGSIIQPEVVIKCFFTVALSSVLLVWDTAANCFGSFSLLSTDKGPAGKPLCCDLHIASSQAVASSSKLIRTALCLVLCQLNWQKNHNHLYRTIVTVLHFTVNNTA